MRVCFVLLAGLVGCGGGNEVGKTITVLGSTGLDTTSSPMVIDSRALVKADNAVIDRFGVIEGRRGFIDSGMAAASGNINAWAYHGGYLIPQFGASSLGYLNGTTLNTYQGDFTPMTGYRTHFAEAANTLYITTNERLYALEGVTGNPIKAGVLTAYPGTASLTGTSGFLAANAEAAYRFVWARKDSNGRIIRGEPSERVVISGLSSPVATSNSGSTARAGTTVTVTTAANHGLSTNDSVYIQSTDVNFPSGTFTVTVTGATTFTYTQSGSATTSTSVISVHRATRNVALAVPMPGVGCFSAAGSVVRTGSTVRVNITTPGGGLAPLSLAVGDTVYLVSADTNFPAGMKRVTAVYAFSPQTYFEYQESGTAGSNTRQLVYNTDLTNGYFLQIYRSIQSATGTTDPGDILYQSYEYTPSATNFIGDTASFSVTDTAPDAVLLGTPLYTNATEEGIANANSIAPAAADIAWDRDVMWYGNLKERPVAKIQLLTTSNFTAGTVAFKLNGTGITSANTESTINGQFKIYTTGTTSQNIANTAQSIARAINGYLGKTFFAQYASGPTDAPGILLIYARSPNVTSSQGNIANAFDMASVTPPGNEWSPRLMASRDISTVTKTTTTVTVNTTQNHGFTTGQEVYVYYGAVSSNVFPTTLLSGVKTVASTPSATQFTYSEAGAAETVSVSLSYAWSVPDYNQSTQAFVATAGTHAVAWSKPGEPECVPLANRMYIGRQDSAVLRVVPLRHSRFVFKEDGLFRITGDSASGYVVDAFDPTVRLLGPGTVAIVQNTIFALTTKGVMAITESGVTPVSTPIQKTLLDLQASALSTIKTTAFGVGYDSYRKYILWLPSANTDTYATQAFVFDLDSKAWTRWTKPAYFAAVDPSSDLLWLSRGTLLSKERKARDYTDHQDEGGAGIAFDVQYAPVYAGSPGTLKHFTDFSALMSGSHLTGLTVGFSTDASTTPTTVALVPPGGTGTAYSAGPIRTVVPLEDQRGAYLNIEFTNSTAQDQPAIGGYTLTVDADGTAVNWQ